MKNTRVLLSITNLKKYFPLKKSSIFSKKQLFVRANDDITLNIYEGETFGLVGESGCGKSTLGRVLIQLYNQTSGETIYYGRTLEDLNPKYVGETLRNPKKFIMRYESACAKLAELQAEKDIAGENAEFELLQKYNNAKADMEKSLSNFIKIFGGLYVDENIEDVSKVLLEKYEFGVEINDLKDKIKEIHVKSDLLHTKRQIKADTGKSIEGIDASIAKLTEKINEIEATINTLTKQQAEAQLRVDALHEKNKGKQDYQKYQAMIDDGIDLSRLSYNEMRPLRKDIQIIFQDPYSSLNPRFTIGSAISEGLTTHKYFKKGSAKMQDYVIETMNKCGLADYMLYRFPHQFSGGQRQRICIARALAVKPKFVVCDECVSALDVSIQSQILNLLQDLKEQENLTYLFISHDLSVVKYISDRVGVMYLGNLVEISETDTIFKDPRHPYTVSLLSAIPTTDPLDKQKEKRILEGSIPSPIFPPSGCKFHTRCYLATEKCKRVPPELIEIEPGHIVACHYPCRKLDENGDFLTISPQQ